MGQGQGSWRSSEQRRADLIRGLERAREERGVCTATTVAKRRCMMPVAGWPEARRLGLCDTHMAVRERARERREAS